MTGDELKVAEILFIPVSADQTGPIRKAADQNPEHGCCEGNDQVSRKGLNISRSEAGQCRSQRDKRPDQSQHGTKSSCERQTAQPACHTHFQIFQRLVHGLLSVANRGRLFLKPRREPLQRQQKKMGAIHVARPKCAEKPQPSRPDPPAIECFANKPSQH